MIRSIFIALGIFIAASQARGEYALFQAQDLYTKSAQRAFIHIVEANAHWPMSYFTREFSAVIFTSADSFPPEVILEYVDSALKQDPLAANLNHFKVINELRRGNLKGSLPAVELLEKYYAGWPETDNARKLYEAVKILLEKRKVDKP